MRTAASITPGLAIFGSIVGVSAVWTWANQAHGQETLIAPGLVLPSMNPENGKLLFARKGCVVCHQVNGVGGADAAPLDAKTMAPVMSPFEFFAKMWRGAEPMIAMQQGEIGGQIEFTGQDLADIIAFTHNQAVQGTFSEDDIPENIKALMQEEDEESGAGMEMKMEQDGGDMMKNGQ